MKKGGLESGMHLDLSKNQLPMRLIKKIEQRQFPIDLLGESVLGSNLIDFFNAIPTIPADMLTQAAHNVARDKHSVDVNVGNNKRLLIYPRTQIDDESYQRLRQAQIPQFSRAYAPVNPEITVVNIPLNAWRLDSSDFPEEVAAGGIYTGAIEIMNTLGTLLKNIKSKTDMLPKDFELCRAAFVTGEKDYIKLVPPYTLSPEVTVEELIERVKHQLSSIDPDNPHENQVEAFTKAITKII